jgi:high-affinity iron transporter
MMVSVSVTGGTAAIERDNRTLVLRSSAATREHDADTHWKAEHVMGDLPTSLSLQDLIDLNGGRIPSGLSVATAPGPFEASWTDETTLDVFTRDGGLVNAERDGTLVLRYSGGGLTTPRVMTVDGWTLEPTYVEGVRAELAEADNARHDRALWSRWVPVALLVTAGALLLGALRRRPRATPEPSVSKDRESTLPLA